MFEVPPLDVQQEGKLRGLWQGARCLPPPERRRDGLRCLVIELRETEIDALIRNGLLAAENRHDYDSVQSALYAFLDRALGKLGDA